MMNRRFRANELGLAEVERNLAPFRPHVETSPGLQRCLPPTAVPGDTPSVETLRRDALEALHTYVVAASGYNLARSMTIFRRITRVIDNALDPVSERSRPHK